jgi:hypothetical protein
MMDYLNTKCKCGHAGTFHYENCLGMCCFNCDNPEHKNPIVKKKCGCVKFEAVKPIYYDA